MANPGGRQNGSLMSWAAAMDGQGPRGGRQADYRAYRQAMVQIVGTSAAVVVDMMAGWAFGRIWGRWNGPSGARKGGRY